ncbi:hypothetical protein [Nocardioides marmotae]|uniref:hypothetical protein n=1 Tax=Nocardioides marmotae TaxID=2663857 RepID=UPI0012B657EC|nr:hypothetical protein [Nocardioides marmotae]MBC9734561.1 hypothetical protein [Nocardioides marmotae]MTB85662.1 hypothetical protein [Nocardioides marmotae]
MPPLPRALTPVRHPSTRPSTRPSGRRLLVPGALALALALSGCGGDPDAAPERATSSVGDAGSGSAGGPDASPTPTPSPTADEETGGPTAEPTKRPRSTLVPIPQQPLHGRRVAGGHLLDATRMPALSADRPWTEVADGAGDTPVGACQKASLFDIGAVQTTGRRFATADGSTTATQVVGRFPDATSAWRATEVLLAWRADCAERLEHARTAVGEVREVPVRTGSGSVYPASYGPRAAARGRATGLGILRKGRWVSVVEVATDAGRWPRDWNPARRAVRRIATTFPA